MVKKKSTKALANDAEKHEIERRKAIADFNTQNMGKYWIDPDKLPTEDDINLAKNEFEKALTDFQKKDYVVADKDNAVRVAEFMKTFINRTVWKGQTFVGVVRFNTQMTEFVKECEEKGAQDLILDYNALMFVFYMFKEYSGVGLDDALWFVDNNEEFVAVHDHIYDLANESELQKKRIENLQMRWQYLAQGYYLTILENSDEDTLDPATAPQNECDCECGPECDCDGQCKSKSECEEHEDR